MQKTQQINIRMEPDLKAGGDAVLHGLGTTPSQAVRALWRYLAREKRLPDALLEDDVPAAPTAQRTQPQPSIDEGAGMVARLAAESGLALPSPSLSYQELRDLAFEEMLQESEAGRA